VLVQVADGHIRNATRRSMTRLRRTSIRYLLFARLTVYFRTNHRIEQSVVGGRQAQDDFIVDDGAGEYVDNGMDDWGEGGQYDSEEEDTRRKCMCSCQSLLM
jgi:hypothetical protein